MNALRRRARDPARVLAQVALDGLEMRAHRRPGGGGIVRADRGEDRLVLGKRAGAPVGGRASG